jgi:hypothetical protein
MSDGITEFTPVFFGGVHVAYLFIFLCLFYHVSLRSEFCVVMSVTTYCVVFLLCLSSYCVPYICCQFLWIVNL